MSTGKLVLGVLAGLAIGSTLGILFAPDKGSTTRKKITRKSGELTDELTDKFNEFIESLTDKFEAMKEKAVETAEEVKEKVKEAAAKAAK